MLGVSKKPGPPVPPRPSATAVATALAKQRENSPSPNGGQRQCNGNGMAGMVTLKPPHPGRTVVYKSPDLERPAPSPQARNRTHMSTFGVSVPQQRQGSPNLSTKRNAIYHESPDQSPKAAERHLLPASADGVMYRSTCSVVEITTSPSTSGSSSVSTSPVATLQKPPTDQKSSKSQKDAPAIPPVARRRLRNGDSHSSEGSPEVSEVIIVNGGTHGSSISLRNGQDADTNGHCKSMGSECDSGTERGDSSGSSASAGSTLERENNVKNLENGGSKSSHFTEIIIGSNQCSAVVRSGSKPNIAPTSSVIRSNSIRLPVGAASAASTTEVGAAEAAAPSHHRPEPEGGEHIQPSSDNRRGMGASSAPGNVSKPQSTTKLDLPTLNTKLTEQNKIAFHELLISELAAMRQKQQKVEEQQVQGGQETPVKKEEPSEVVDLAKINRRQRCPSERRSSGSETETTTTPNGTTTRLPKIRTADWIEVGDNGKQMVLSSCQISLEDSGMEDEEKLDDASSGVGDSWDSIKEDAEERIIMSLPGLPPLPKSLSGFDLAGMQFQSSQHHHHHHHQHHHQQHHPSQHNPHYPPVHHQPPASAAHHHPMQQQQSSFPSSHPSSVPPSSQSPAGVLNHHHTNPFIPIGSGLLHGDSLASLESQQRGHSPVSSTLSGGSSGGRKASPQPGVGPASTSTLDTQLAILRREMYGLRQLDLSLLSQLWALNESIQEFRTMLQEQETLSPPSPSPSNSDANSVSSDDDLDEDDSSTTTNSNRMLQQHPQQHLLLSAHHPLQSSTNSIVGAGSGSSGGGGGGGNLTPSGGPTLNESGGSSSTTLSSSASSRMRAPPPPPPNRKAPSRPV